MRRVNNYSSDFIEMAERGAEVYYMHALYWLSEAYIKHYPIPRYCTVIYYASIGWAKKLCRSTHPLAINAICQPVMHLYPFINTKFTHAYSNPLHFERMSNDEIYEVCIDMIEYEIKAEQDLCDVLCAGLKIALDYNLNPDCYMFSDISFDVNDETFFDGYIFKSKNLQNLKLHIFKSDGIMSEFHFIVDFLKFLATDELRLVYQRDDKRQLKQKGKLCSWDDYREMEESFRDKFLSKRYPLEEMTSFYIEDLDMKLYKWDKTTIKELMAVRGLTPHEKYANYIERSHQLTLKRAS